MGSYGRLDYEADLASGSVAVNIPPVSGNIASATAQTAIRRPMEDTLDEPVMETIVCILETIKLLPYTHNTVVWHIFNQLCGCTTPFSTE
jgi:hypothetical protein